MPRHRIIWLTTLVLVVAAVVSFILLRDKPQTVRLANGTELTFLAITHGASNVYQPGGGLQKLINLVAPANGIKLGPVKIQQVPPLVDRSLPSTNPAVLWIRHRRPANAPLPVRPVFWSGRWLPDVRATIAEGSGEEWEATTERLHLSPLGGLSAISSWCFASFPRRGNSLRLRVYARDSSNQWQAQDAFEIANPTPGPHPVWEASELPMTGTNGSLEMSLVELVTPTTPDAPGTRAIVEMKENGLPLTTFWWVEWMEAGDATGNRVWVDDLGGARYLLKGYPSEGRAWLRGPHLSPNEVWKLRVRFKTYGTYGTNASPILTRTFEFLARPEREGSVE